MEVEISPFASKAATNPTASTAAMISVRTATALFFLFMIPEFALKTQPGAGGLHLQARAKAGIHNARAIASYRL